MKTNLLLIAAVALIVHMVMLHIRIMEMVRQAIEDRKSIQRLTNENEKLRCDERLRLNSVMDTIP